MRLLILVLLFSCFNAQAFYHFVRAKDSSIDGQDGWVYKQKSVDGFSLNYVDGWATNYVTAGGTVTATLTLGTNFPAGDVSAWALIAKACTVTFIIDGQTNSVEKTTTSSTAELVRVGVFTGVSGFSSVIMSVYSASSQNIIFEGVMLTDDVDASVPGSPSALSFENYTLMSFPQPTDVAASEVTTPATNCIRKSAFFPFGGFGSVSSTNRRSMWRSQLRTYDTNSPGDWCMEIGDSTNQVGYRFYSDWFQIHPEFEKRTVYSLAIQYEKFGTGNPVFITVEPLFYPNSTTATNIQSRTNTQYVLSWYPPETSGISVTNFNLPLQGGWYRLYFNDVQPGTNRFHAISLIKGSDQTNWVPFAQAEFSLSTTNVNGAFDEDETTRPIRVLTYNTGPSFTRTLDVSESVPGIGVLTNYSVSFTCAAGTSTNSFNMRSIRRGSVYVQAYARDIPGPYPEGIMTTGVKFRVPTNTHSTNFHIAAHAEIQPFVNEAMATYGIKGFRGLSPTRLVEPDLTTSDGISFDWSMADDDMDAVEPYGNVIISLNSKGDWPSYFTNGLGGIDITAWSNWCYAVMSRYTNRVTVYESWNEPQEDDAAFVSNSTNMVNVITALANVADTLAIPGVEVWHIGGIASIGAFITDTWTALDPSIQAMIYAVSWHNYFENSYLLRWAYEKLFNRLQVIDAMFDYVTSRGIPKIIDSESGIYGTALDISTFPIFGSEWQPIDYVFQQYHLDRAWNYDTMQRPRLIYRWVMRGATWVYYTGRDDAYPGFWSSGDEGWDGMDRIKPEFAVALNFNNFYGFGSAAGRVTNASLPYLECYAGQAESGTNFMVMFSQSRTNCYLPWATNLCNRYDAFGNLVEANVTALSVGPNPIFLMSSAVSTNDMITCFTGATGWMTNAYDPPVIQILRASQGQDPIIRKANWTVLSRSPNDSQLPNLNQTRWSLNGTNKSEWSNRFYAEAPSSLANGTYRWEIEGIDELGQTNIAFGPSFTVGVPSGSGTLDASTINVGTLIINP